MRPLLGFTITIFALCAACVAQNSAPGPTQAPPRSEQQNSRDRNAEAEESSSRDTRIDLKPPANDAKDHPNSGVAVSGIDNNPEDEVSPDVGEMHPFNPYRAIKDDEVGDFYFKKKNYKAALARYQDALIYKQNDAVANFRIAQCLDKLGRPEAAIPHYKEYLRILPEGPFSKDARKALEKAGVPEGKSETSAKAPQP